MASEGGRACLSSYRRAGREGGEQTLVALRLRPTTAPSLLTTGLGDALNDRVVHMRIGNNDAAPSITEPDRDGRALLVIADLLA